MFDVERFVEEWTAQGLEAAGGKSIETSGVALLDSSIIHAVTNPLGQFTGAIHVYGGDFFATPRSEWPSGREECAFDVERAQRVFAEANERWRRETPPPSAAPRGASATPSR